MANTEYIQPLKVTEEQRDKIIELCENKGSSRYPGYATTIRQSLIYVLENDIDLRKISYSHPWGSLKVKMPGVRVTYDVADEARHKSRELGISLAEFTRRALEVYWIYRQERCDLTK